MRNCLGPAKVQYAVRTLPLRHTAFADFAEGVTVTQRATWNTVVGTPVSNAAWVQATLPMSEGGCGGWRGFCSYSPVRSPCSGSPRCSP